jgi:hypothetical protein
VRGGGEAFEVSSAKPLFDARSAVLASATGYDVAADGRRFLVYAMQGELTSTPVTVCSADLKR